MYQIIQKLENIESMLQYNPDYRAKTEKRQRASEPLTEAEIQEIANIVYEDKGGKEFFGPDSTKEEVLRAYLKRVRKEKEDKIAEANALYESFEHCLTLMDNPSYYESLDMAGKNLLNKWKIEGIPTTNEIMKDFDTFTKMKYHLTD